MEENKETAVNEGNENEVKAETDVDALTETTASSDVQANNNVEPDVKEEPQKEETADANENVNKQEPEQVDSVEEVKEEPAETLAPDKKAKSKKKADKKPEEVAPEKKEEEAKTEEKQPEPVVIPEKKEPKVKESKSLDKKKLIAIILAAVLVLGIVIGVLFAFVLKGDSFNSNITYKGNTAVAELVERKDGDEGAMFDVKYDVKMEVETSTKQISELRINNVTVEGYKYDGKVLTLPKSLIADQKLSAGEYKLRIFAGDGSKPIERNLFIATKIIRTCQDFQDIGNDAGTCGGAYILGNDLDFKDFGYFEPIGDYYSEGYRKNFVFSGIFEGNGYKIKNIKIKSSECTHVPHKVDFGAEYGANLAIFSYIADIGIVRNATFVDCTIETGSLIAGVVAGTNQGTIENCIVVGGSVSSYMSQLLWLDFNCFIAGFAGVNGGTGVINNCVCMIDSVEYSYNPKCVRVFCGKNWGTISNCVGAEDGVRKTDITDAPTREQINDPENTAYNTQSIDIRNYYDGFTYTAIEPGATGYMGTVNNCVVSVIFEMMQEGNIGYVNLDKEIWNIVEDEIPSINRILK